MKVTEDNQDRFGRYPIWFTGGNLKEIHEWLYSHYNGYKFVIVLDETKGEYEPLEVPTPVYFADEVLDEIADFYDLKTIKKQRGM